MKNAARKTVSASPTWTVLSILACLPLAACGDKKASLVTITGSEVSTETVALGNGYGLNMPKAVGGFVRTETSGRPDGTEFVAGYVRTEPPAPIIATVRVHKAAEPGSLGLIEGYATAATNDRSQGALSASIAQVRRVHPEAALVNTAPAFLVRFGAMQHGRSATLSYTDIADGVRQPVDLRIETFCCADGRWNYEFRFRYPASLVGIEGPIADFLRDIAWSAEPAGSIDKPE